MKYGALSNGTGSILIEWTIEPGPQGGQIMLHWQEKDGPPVTPPRHEGFGSRVIEHGLDALNATVKLDYLPTGLHCTMRIPVPQGVKKLYIEPGSPWENGYCESLNSKLRDELLNGEIFTTMREAQVLIAVSYTHLTLPTNREV